VLGALIAQATTAVADPPDDLTNYVSTEPAYLNMSQLLTYAQQLPFPALLSQAQAKLDEILHNLAQRVVAVAKAQQSSPGAATETQQAVSDLKQELQVGDADGVPAIDPGFNAFIQQEIDSLSGGMTAKVLAGLPSWMAAEQSFNVGEIGTTLMVPYECQVAFASCKSLGITLLNGGTMPFSPSTNDLTSYVSSVPPQSLPVTIADSVMTDSITLSQPAKNVIAWDSSIVGDGTVAFVVLQINFNQAGTLQIEINGQAQAFKPFDFFYPKGVHVFYAGVASYSTPSPNAANGFDALGLHGLMLASPAQEASGKFVSDPSTILYTDGSNNPLPGPVLQVPVSSGTQTFFLIATSGAGRVMTFTFTPGS
jgi:hypothetical protein